MIKLLKRICWLLLFFPILTFAKREAAGLGLVAKNMLEPVGLMSDFVQTACFLIGGSFIFACIVKYIEHRRSPLMVPISTVIFLLVAGILLISLPLITYFAPGAIHYSLLSEV